VRKRNLGRVGLIALTVSAALVGTIIEPVAFPAYAEVDVDAPADGILPPLESSSPQVPALTAPTGDFADPVRATAADQTLRDEAITDAEAPDPTTIDTDSLVPIALDEFSTDYAVDGGFTVTKVSAEPVNIQTDSGAWVPISTDVVESDGAGEVANNPLSPQFGADAGDNGVFTISDDTREVTFSLLGANSSDFSTDQLGGWSAPPNDVLYHDVFENVDLSFDVAANAVREALVLGEAPATGLNHWTWRVASDGLALQLDADGSISMVDSQGLSHFVVPLARMWDSSAIGTEREAAEHPVPMSLVHNSSGTWDIKLTADAEWLADASRVYPVFVDPAPQTSPTNLDDSTQTAYKSDGATRTDGVHIGNSRDSGTNKYWRTIAKYDYSGLFGKQVIKAAVVPIAQYGGTSTERTGSVYSVDLGCNGYTCADQKLSSWTVAF
jgi:large repetitive protein